VISISISAAGGSAPTITASGFSGSANVAWPSSLGPQFQALSPGNPVALSGFTG
jgi:hypothetical protein